MMAYFTDTYMRHRALLSLSRVVNRAQHKPTEA